MSDKKTPAKWHTIYRGNDDKCFFSGKDGKSGLARSEYDWRTTDSLSRESGLSKKRTEEIIEHYCKKGVVLQHSKDPEKWGYWERVGVAKSDPDPVKKDHDDRAQKQVNNNSGLKKPASGTGTKATGTTPTPKVSPGTGASAPIAGKTPTKSTPRCPTGQPQLQPNSPGSTTPVKKKVTATPVTPSLVNCWYD